MKYKSLYKNHKYRIDHKRGQGLSILSLRFLI